MRLIKLVVALLLLLLSIVGVFAVSVLAESAVLYINWNFLIVHVYPHPLTFYQCVYLAGAILSYRLWWLARMAGGKKKC